MLLNVGATCSQFLLNGAIKIHLEQYKQHDLVFTEKILKCIEGIRY